jgi:energy-coupling factor transporter ATP-binding protein EcfA2
MCGLYVHFMRKKSSHLKTLIAIGCVIVLTNILVGLILYVALVDKKEKLISSPDREFIFATIAIVFGAIAYLSLRIFRNQPNLNGASKLHNSQLSPEFLKESRYQLYKVVRAELEKRLYEKIPKQGLMQLEINETDTLSLLSNPDRLSIIKKKFSHTNCFWVCPDEDNNLFPKLDTKIYNIFHGKKRKLLILGDAGSGKSTMIQKLAHILLNRFTPDNKEPIPVIFELTYWNPHQSIQQWLVKELKSKYNLQKDIAEYWLNTHQILPILDNLDEQTKARKECRIAINNFLNQNVDVPLVVCCRLKEYSKIDTRIQLNVIELKPLPLKEIKSYLILANQEKLWKQINNHSDFKNYARFPLYVKLISEMNEPLPIIKKPDLISQDGYRKYYCDCLLNQYIKHQLATDKQLKEENTEKWLIWLAKTLEQQRIKDFLIERIQPNWLKYESHLLRRYFIAYGISSGLIFGLISAAITSLFDANSIVLAIVSAIISALISVLIHGQVDEIVLFEEFQISWDEIVAFWKNPIQLLLCALIPIIISQIFLECFISLILKKNLYSLSVLIIHNSDFSIIRNDLQLIEQLVVILPVLTTILITVLFSGRKTEIKNIEIPNQGVKDSFVSAVILMITGTTIISSLHLIVSHYFTGDFVLTHSIVLGLSIGTLIGLLCGGFATIQHYILRLILCISGFAPWDYPKFLAYVAERGLILQRGGRYRFVHQLIRERFVQM